MNILVTRPSERTIEFDTLGTSVLIRVPRIDLPRRPSPRAARRRLRREVRWAAHGLSAIGLFALGLVVGGPGRHGNSAPTAEARIDEVRVESLIVPFSGPSAGSTPRGRVVHKGILPEEDVEEGRHAGR